MERKQDLKITADHSGTISRFGKDALRRFGLRFGPFRISREVSRYCSLQARYAVAGMLSFQKVSQPRIVVVLRSSRRELQKRRPERDGSLRPSQPRFYCHQGKDLRAHVVQV